MMIVTRQLLRRIALAAFIACAAAPMARAQGTTLDCPDGGAAERGRGDRWIVVLRRDFLPPFHPSLVDATPSSRPGADALAAPVEETAKSLLATVGGELVHVYSAVLGGFAAAMSPEQAAAIARRPEVEFVEADSSGVIAACPGLDVASWGLDRIDQSGPPLDSSYRPCGTGAGIRIYVLDTGVSRHEEFGDRLLAGYSALGDAVTEDCHGHGTHVAGIAAGRSAGVASRALVVPIRVLGCDGRGFASDVVEGIDWAVLSAYGVAAGATSTPINWQPIVDAFRGRRAPVPLHPGVVNLSLTFCPSDAMDLSVRAAMALGLSVVVASGNQGLEPSAYSPARVAAALVVASIDDEDEAVSMANQGPGLSLYAPGDDICSASTQVVTPPMPFGLMSGTSMAAAHVAGAAAQILERHPQWEHVRVKKKLLNAATHDAVSSNSNGAPNRLLRVPRCVPALMAFAPLTKR